MVMPAIKPLHTHKFEINSRGLGRCQCGEVRQYVSNGNMKDNSYRIIEAGDPNYKDPAVPLSPFTPAPTAAKPVENITNNIYQKEQIEANSTAKTDKNAEMLVKPAVEQYPIMPRERLQFRLKHRKEILHDIDTIGKKATQDKWGLTKKSIAQFIKARRERGEEKPPATKGAPVKSETVKPEVKPQPVQPASFEKVYVESTSTIGIDLINRLIDYWNAQLTDTHIPENMLTIQMTIDCLEQLAGIEREAG
jgi:hypothetical protein